MKYTRIVAEFYSRVWAIREETLAAMQELLRLQSVEGLKWSIEEIRQRIDASNAANGYTPHDRGEARFIGPAKIEIRDRTAFSSGVQEEIPMQAASGKRNAAAAPGSVAVIPITGIISHRASMMGDISGPGGTSTQKLSGQFRQALEDTNCKAIVFDVDSPGGCVEGVTELASEIFNARGQKPITAVCNAMAASAAYWLGSAAKETVVTPSGQAGSIGVFMMLQDESAALEKDGIKINLIKAGKYKAEGHPSQPLSDETRAFLQSQVDSVYSMFVKAVAQNRGTSQAAVRDGYGQGRCLLAADAVKAGLADRVATLDDVLAEFGVKGGAAGARASADPKVAAEGKSESTTEPQSRGEQSRMEKLKTRTSAADNPKDKPDNDDDDDDDDDNYCSCACAACQACTGTGARGKADDSDMGCSCACNACRSCDYKSDSNAKAAANRRRRMMELL